MRLSPSSLLKTETTKPRASNSMFNFREDVVDLSVKNAPKVARRLRLIGDPYMFWEFTDKVYVPNPTNDPALRGKTIKKEFPDAHIKKSFTRIGHEDQSQCPWKKMGYICTMQFAQNCLEKQDDGTWKVKVLKKGKAIFHKIAEEIALRYADETNEDGDGRHFGTRNAPCIKIIAEATGKQPPLSVDYKILFESKPTYIDDDMIEQLRKAGDPSTDKLVRERTRYEKDRKSDPLMPEWEDFFAYGHAIEQIYKFTPVASDESDTVSIPSKPVVEEEEITPIMTNLKPFAAEEDEDEDEGYVVKPPKKAVTKKPVVIEDDEDEDDDENSLAWMGNR